MLLKLTLTFYFATYCSLSGVPRKMLSATRPFHDANRVEGCVSHCCRFNIHARKFVTNNKNNVTNGSIGDSGLTSTTIGSHLVKLASLDGTITLSGCARVHGVGFLVGGTNSYPRGNDMRCGRLVNRTCCFHT